MDYKTTLNLPQNRLPMKANLVEKEKLYQAQWKEKSQYKNLLEMNKGNKSFILHDGPPYANGNLHVGHALNKILKDFIVRYHTLKGEYTPFVPGWDTHGLPIENKMIETKKINRKEIDPVEFRKMCEEFALEQIEIQKEQFIKMGVLGDYDNYYVTLDPTYESMQLKIFGKMVNEGVVYKGLRTVFWSPSSESALAEAEIEYHDKKSKSIYVKFPVQDGKGIIPEDASFVIWTTTAWTIPSNLGIAANHELEYGLYETSKGKLVFASSLLEQLKENLELENVSLIKKFMGTELELAKAKHPLYDRESLLVLGDHVTADSGTGLVHTAPGHGEDDYNVGKEYGLEILSPVDGQGKYTVKVNDDSLVGVYYEKANDIIIDRLSEAGYLLKLEEITHSYPHDWRTKKPIIQRATAQWFASLEKIKSELLSEIEKIDFPADWARIRLTNMIKDRKDWCISRQRIWGVPIPIFYSEDGEPILDQELIEHVATLVKEHGTNVWYEREANELLPAGYTHPASPNNIFTKETDIMDVWFDSGSSHTSVLQTRPELSFPADLYLEGSDQYRGWFNSSLINSVAYNGVAPYRQLLSHGFVLDGQGRKMSKSIGNVVDPLSVINQHGADILRLWVSASNYSEDVRISPEIIEQTKKSFMKIRNTIRFIEGNISDLSDANRVEFADLSVMDKYMIEKTNKLNNDVLNAYEEYKFLNVFKAINNFCIVDLSSFYLNYTKDILYVESVDSKARRSVQTAYEHILKTLTKLIAPIMIHTAEDINQTLFAKSIMEERLAVVDKIDEELIAKIEKFENIRDAVNKVVEEARNNKEIKTANELAISLSLSQEHANLLDMINTPIKQLLSVAKLEYKVVEGETIKVDFEVSGYEKCERCWNFEENTVDNLCPRCRKVLNVK